MVKINISEVDLTLNVTAADRSFTVDLFKGLYKNKKYTTLFIFDRALVLSANDGSEVVLGTNVVTVSVNYHTVKDKLSRILQDSAVYLYGVDAIPEGQEREVLKNLIQ